MSIPAQATSLYFEAGPGVSQLLNSAGLFGDIADGQHSIGMGLNFMLGLNLAKSDLSGFQLHFGPKYFYLTSGNDEATFVYQAVYPALRFEFRRFYFGGGVTPIVFASQSSTAFSPPTTTPSSLAAFGEFGLLWRVVPFFHLAAEASAHFARSIGGISPKPGAAITMQMRFFIYQSKKTGKEIPFDGWRYPFGIELRDN